MDNPSDLIKWEVVSIILVMFGVATLTSLFWKKLVDVWRIRWIYIEHELAKCQNREPRKIEDVFPSYFNM